MKNIKNTVIAYIITEVSVILLCIIVMMSMLPKSPDSSNVVLAVDSRCLDKASECVSVSFNGFESHKLKINTDNYISTPELTEEESKNIRSLTVSSIDVNVYDKQNNLIDKFENIKVDKYNPFKNIKTVYIYQDKKSIYYEYNQTLILLALFVLSTIIFVLISIKINKSKRTRLR